MTPHRLLDLLATAREACGGILPSVFGHMRVRTGGRESDVLLGTAKRLGSGVSIIDWQTAPLAEVFFETSTEPERTLPPEVSAMSAAARALARSTPFGSTRR